MQLSIWPGFAQPWPDVLAIARHADETGWAGVWLADHFMADAAGPYPEHTPTIEATSGLAALAVATQNVRIGSLVLGATYRHPAVLASWAAGVDQISRGRLVLGVGAGWQQNEHDQYGIVLPPPRDRVDRFDEYLKILRGLLHSGAGERFSLEGSWFQVSDALCEPKPVQTPMPILVGTQGDRMLGITAREANEWNMWSTPDRFAERSGFLDQKCEAIGRDPSEIRRSTQALVMITDDDEVAKNMSSVIGDRPAVFGSITHFVDRMGEYRDAGADEFIVFDSLLGRDLSERLDTMDLLVHHAAELS